MLLGAYSLLATGLFASHSLLAGTTTRTTNLFQTPKLAVIAQGSNSWRMDKKRPQNTGDNSATPEPSSWGRTLEQTCGKLTSGRCGARYAPSMRYALITIIIKSELL